MHVPITIFQKYYDVPKTDETGYYKQWVMSTERMVKSDSVNHFVPFASRVVTKLPARHVQTANVSPAQSPDPRTPHSPSKRF